MIVSTVRVWDWIWDLGEGGGERLLGDGENVASDS